MQSVADPGFRGGGRISGEILNPPLPVADLHNKNWAWSPTLHLDGV